MNNFLVVGFYTPKYKKYKDKLQTSLEKFGFVHYFVEYEDKGSWQQNTMYKAVFLYITLQEQKYENILYLDVDSEVLSSFEWPEGKFDIAVHRYKDKHISNGTIFLKNNDTTKFFLKTWIEKQPFTEIEQNTMERLLRKNPNIVVKYLSEKYLSVQKQEEDTLIKHDLASQERSLIEPPKEYNGIKIYHIGREIYIRKPDPKVISYLDTLYERIPGKYQWILKPNKLLQEEHIFKDKSVYIVGKGPSLDRATEFIFEDDPTIPIICINHAILRIQQLPISNPLYTIIKDPLKINIEKGKIFLAEKRAGTYPNNYCIKYDPAQFEHSYGDLTLKDTLSVAKYLGSKRFYFIGFDSVYGDLDYAPSLDMVPVCKDRIAESKEIIEKELKNYQYEFLDSLQLVSPIVEDDYIKYV